MQVVISLTADPSDNARKAALAAGGPAWCRSLLGGWFQYFPVNGNVSKARRTRSMVEADADRLGLEVEVISPRNLPIYLREKGFIPNELRNTENGFCTTFLAGEPAVETPDPTFENQYPLHFTARDADGHVFGRGSCNRGVVDNVLDAFHGRGATHLDVRRRSDDVLIDTIRWRAPAPPARAG